jgi:hypothetical protein
LLDLQSRSEQIDICEKEEFEFDHADVGLNLLKIWKWLHFIIDPTIFHILHSMHLPFILKMFWPKQSSWKQWRTTILSQVTRGSLGKPEKL